MLCDVLQVIFRRTTGRTDRGRTTTTGRTEGQKTDDDDGRTWTDGQRTGDDGTDGRTEDDDDDGTRRDTTGRTERISNIHQKVYRWLTPRNRHAQTFLD
jgi:hypothetical protein